VDGAIPHAWLTINGKVVDVAREAAGCKRKRDYFGTCIDRRTVDRGWGEPITPHERLRSWARLLGYKGEA